MGVTVLFELADSLQNVNGSRNKGEQASQDDHNNGLGSVSSEVEHDPGDAKKLKEGTGLAGPVRIDVNFAVEMMNDGDADQNNEVAADDEDGKPDGQTDGPVSKTQGENGRQHEGFVGYGIEDTSKTGSLIEMPGDEAVDPVAQGSERKGDNGGNPKIDVRAFCLNARPVVDGQSNENRDQENPGDGDFVGGSHFEKVSEE